MQFSSVANVACSLDHHTYISDQMTSTCELKKREMNSKVFSPQTPYRLFARVATIRIENRQCSAGNIQDKIITYCIDMLPYRFTATCTYVVSIRRLEGGSDARGGSGTAKLNSQTLWQTGGFTYPVFVLLLRLHIQRPLKLQSTSLCDVFTSHNSYALAQGHTFSLARQWNTKMKTPCRLLKMVKR